MTNNSDKSNRRGPIPPNFTPSRGHWLWWLVAFFAIIAAWSYIGGHKPPQQQQDLSYSAFKQQLRDNNIKSITVEGRHVNGQLKSSSGGKPTAFTTTLLPMDDPQLMGLLNKHDVAINAKVQQPSLWPRLLIAVLPWLLLIGLFYYGSKKMRERMGGGSGGIFSFGKSRAKRVQALESNVTLNDVAGCENAKRDVKEIIDFLKDPRRYHRIGAVLPKGVLLTGHPGTGKTLLAKAVAGEAGVPFFSISGSEFVEMFVGVGASRVRDMFKQAKDAAPSIIFIDEIDAIGRSRGTGLGGGHDEREQTLNQILSEMDGFAPRETVIVMAATNRPDVLDPALMRPGRFDRKIAFDLPTRRAREAILKVHARHIALHGSIDFDGLAAATAGFSGADLANLVNEAAMRAGSHGKDSVDMEEFTDAYNRIALGAKREDLIDDEEKRVIAFHESGHTLMARLLKNADPVEQVTIIPRGRALGATRQTPERDRYNLNRSYLMDRLCVMLGGRGAEKLIFGEVSTGAAQDLKQATSTARQMVSQWGMSDTFGPSAFAVEEQQSFIGQQMLQQQHYSEHTIELIDEETRRIIEDSARIVDETLKAHREHLEKLAAALIEHETVEGPELDEILGIRDPQPAAEPAPAPRPQEPPGVQPAPVQAGGTPQSSSSWRKS